jgi:hypothetical protein
VGLTIGFGASITGSRLSMEFRDDAVMCTKVMCMVLYEEFDVDLSSLILECIYICLLALRAINTCRLRPDAGQIPLMRPFDRNMRKDHVKMWEEN